jgi:hypothetical protein
MIRITDRATEYLRKEDSGCLSRAKPFTTSYRLAKSACAVTIQGFAHRVYLSLSIASGKADE